jgi:hypothetical protein
MDTTYEEDECLSTSGGSLHGIVSETHTDEDDGKDGETHKLIISKGTDEMKRYHSPGLASFPSYR